MTLLTISTLTIIAAIAVVSPILSDLSGRFRIPDVVVQLLLGIIVGPQVLDVARSATAVPMLSAMGLSFLMFLAGYELDLARISGRPLRAAAIGWSWSLGLALVAAVCLVASGVDSSVTVLALALTSTALGTLVPILRDAHVLDGRFGGQVMAIGTLGEFAPIVAIAVLLSQRRPAITTAVLALFAAIALGTIVLAGRRRPKRMVDAFHRHLHTTVQLPIRVSILSIVGMVYLASELGLDVLLGAFAAGIVVHFLSLGDDEAVVRGKLEAIGYGFLIPVFFVTSGMALDLHALVAAPAALLLLPLFLVLLLVVRGVPTFVLARHDLARPERLALSLLSSTALPMIVVVTTIGLDGHRIAPSVAAALVGAGIASVLLFPLIATALLRRTARPSAPLPPESSHLQCPSPCPSPDLSPAPDRGRPPSPIIS